MTEIRKDQIRKPGEFAVSRRGFLAGSAGLTFAVGVAGAHAHLMLPSQAKAATPGAIGLWVTVHPDDTITILTPGAEMGQGSSSGVPVVLADEMDADWSKVKLDWAPADASKYGYRRGSGRSMAIVGSRAVQSYYADMRVAGAQVRKVLIDAAAKKWGVPASEVSTEPNAVVHRASGRRLSYGEIAGSTEMPSSLPQVTRDDLKKPSAFRLIGHSQPRKDIPLKVNGTAQFAIDVELPGMVYASVVHSPVQGAEPESWNADAIKAMKGVIGTRKVAKGVAVIAETFEAVLAARYALEVQWGSSRADGYDSETALEKTYAQIHEDPNASSSSVDSKGDADAAFASAAKVFKAEYRSDYGYHAQMEPLNATARFNDAGDRLEVWDGTQAPSRTREIVAEACGLPESAVTLHQCYMGGGYGRRSLGDYTVEAALLARDLRKPVKMIWTREEDIAHGMFRPQNFQCVEAAMDATGKVTGWRHCVVGDGGGLLSGGMKIPYYGVPNQDISLRGTSHGIRLKHWRAVAHVFNIYAIEESIDRMAAEAGVDPIAFRIERMGMGEKGRRVFAKVAEMCDWTAQRPEGRAVGVSITERSGSLGACAAEISLDRESGKIRVHKVWMAVDGGTIVQPDAARANVESGIMHGLSSVLHERVTIKGGAVEQSNFHDYQLMRMSDVPDELHVEFVAPLNPRPTGLGEIGNPPIPSALASAFHRLTGKRLSHMPFTPERVQAALKA